MIVKNTETKEHNIAAFDVVCDAAEFEKALNEAYRKNKAKILVPGFRKGKAPRMVVEGMYGKDIFHEDAVDELAPEAYAFGVEQAGLRAVGRPSLTGFDVSDDKELTLSFTTAVWPEVTLGQYKGLEAVKQPVVVTDEEVEQEIARVQRRNARIASVERPAKDGDTAIIDYLGTVDGVPFDGGKDEGHGLVLGSGTFIPGFEEQVIGMAPGEEKDITVTFPTEYHAKELAGKEAVFHVKVNELKEEIVPELDDEFAKDVSEFDTLDEYRASVRERLEKSAQESADIDFQNALIEKAAENITADIPEGMIDDQLDNIVNEYDQNLRANGMSLETYLGYMGQNIASFRQSTRPAAERRVKIELLLDKVAAEEGVEVTDEDIEEAYAKAAEDYGVDLEVVKKAVSLDAVTGDIKSRRAAQIIFDSGVAVDPPAAEEAPAEEASAEETPAEEAPAASEEAAE